MSWKNRSIKIYIYACCLSIYYIHLDIKAAHGVYPATGSYRNGKPPQVPSNKIKDYFLTQCRDRTEDLLASLGRANSWNRCLFWYCFSACWGGTAISLNQLLVYSIHFTNAQQKITKQEGWGAAKTKYFWEIFLGNTIEFMYWSKSKVFVHGNCSKPASKGLSDTLQYFPNTDIFNCTFILRTSLGPRTLFKRMCWEEVEERQKVTVLCLKGIATSLAQSRRFSILIEKMGNALNQGQRSSTQLRLTAQSF